MRKYLLIVIALLISGCALINEVDEVFITDYLNNKYGSDITFTPMYTSSCKVYETGTCRASYTSSITADKEIHIIWNEKDGSDLRDDFLFLKYNDKLKDYYANIIRTEISGTYKISEITNKSDYKWDKDLTFDEFVKYENLNSGIAVNIANSNIDLNNLADRIKTKLQNSNINNVASLYLTSYNSSCNLLNINSCKKVNSIFFEVKIVEFYDENAKKS